MISKFIGILLVLVGIGCYYISESYIYIYLQLKNKNFKIGPHILLSSGLLLFCVGTFILFNCFN